MEVDTLRMKYVAGYAVRKNTRSSRARAKAKEFPKPHQESPVWPTLGDPTGISCNIIFSAESVPYTPFLFCVSEKKDTLSLLTSVGAEALNVRSKRRDQNSDRFSSRLRAEPR